MCEAEKPGYWAVIPATVRYDQAIPPNAKLLYAEISALCDAAGYCFATNKYFMRNFGLSEDSIRRLIKALSERGYVEVIVERDSETKTVLGRKIFAGINPAQEASPPPLKNKGTSPQNQGDPSPQKYGVHISKESSLEHTPLNSPQGGKCAHKGKAPREAPDWEPARFEGLWRFYPAKGKRNKQRAMNAWDKLRPSKATIDAMADALKKLVASEEWQKGIGIPHVSTFLNNLDDYLGNAAELDPSKGQSAGDVGERKVRVWA